MPILKAREVRAYRVTDLLRVTQLFNRFVPRDSDCRVLILTHSTVTHCTQP